MLRAEQSEALDRARRVLDAMRAAVEEYTMSLRRSGVDREIAVALVETAARGGAANSRDAGDDAAASIVQLVEKWCREAYAAA